MLLVIQAMGTTYMYPPSGNLRGQTDIEVSEGRELLSVSPSCVRPLHDEVIPEASGMFLRLP